MEKGVWGRKFLPKKADCFTGWDKYHTQKSTKISNIHLVRFLSKFNIKGAKILDIGCGSGTNLKFMQDEGAIVYGIDASKTAVELARKKIGEPNTAIPNVVYGQFQKLPFETSFFDAVVDINAIQHNTISGIKKTLKEVHRVLKPNGYFFSVMFSIQDSSYKTGSTLGHDTYIDVNNIISHYSTEQEVKKLLFKSKFSNIVVDYAERTENNQKIIHAHWIVECRCEKYHTKWSTT